jgi:hypothetical protein
MDDPRSLTGVWDGLFSYPRILPPTTFTAVMFEAGAAISGTTHEISRHPQSAGQTLNASIGGARSDADVRFTKVYDVRDRGMRAPVYYVGVVNADATEIEGTWTIRGDWSGKFLMIRSGQPPEAAQVRARRSVPVG